jgi:CheY-like chemotaxis protein
MADRRVQRVLVVEDETLVALDLEDLLLQMGHHVLGPATRVAEAVALARDADFDFAILDVNLAGSPSYPVADILRERGIPFVFSTGYGAAGLADAYSGEQALSKPYQPHELERAISIVCAGATTSTFQP